MDMALGTLAPKTLIVQSVGDVVTESTWCSSVRLLWSLGDFTPISNAGPIRVGIAHSDYTAAEIEAWIESQLTWDVGNLVAQETARRKIREVGVFQSPPAGGNTGSAVLNDGKPITTRCGWLLSTGQTIDVWAYNEGSVALATSDPNLHPVGHANLWPK